MVYIREAHPEDGWVITSNREQDIAFNDPVNNDERHEAAASCAIRLKIRMPVVVDDIDDKIASAYGALPDNPGELTIFKSPGQVKIMGILPGVQQHKVNIPVQHAGANVGGDLVANVTKN